MKIIQSPAEMSDFCESLRKEGKTIALVPTMGALHEGHMSLIDTALRNADVCVVSIFVNPTQFGPNEDFQAYPRQLEADAKACEERGVSAVFAPTTGDIYAKDASTYVVEEQISSNLCGKSRPTHFRGVTTVVTILFNIVRPDFAVFGEKDAQQVSVIERMVRDSRKDCARSSCKSRKRPCGKLAQQVLARLANRCGPQVKPGSFSGQADVPKRVHEFAQN